MYTAATRTVVKRNYAVIAPDGYINSNVPGWDNSTVNVIISEEMGAQLCQTLVTAGEGAQLQGKTLSAQIFFYVIKGEATANISGQTQTLAAGGYVYVPIGKDYIFDNIAAGTEILTFHKVFEPLEGYEIPGVYFGNQAGVPGPDYLDDPALHLQVLLPDDKAFDMAVNIFTYDPGAYLPIVETHIMEHGLMYLQGQAVYKLEEDWYALKKGDSLWMGPYCPQWACSFGKEPSVYIYYKNVNRFPTIQ